MSWWVYLDDTDGPVAVASHTEGETYAVGGSTVAELDVTDALVAEKVMGWHEWRGDEDYDGQFPMFRSWDERVYVYHTDGPGEWFIPSVGVRDAFCVIERMTELGWRVTVSQRTAPDVVPWWVTFEQQGHVVLHGFGATAPEAICRAALEVPHV